MVSLCYRIRAINLLKRMQVNALEKPQKKRRKNHDGARTKNPYSSEDFFDEYYEKYKVLLFYLEPYDYSFLALSPFFFLVYLVCVGDITQSNNGRTRLTQKTNRE